VRSVERRNGDQVERGERKIEQDAVHEHQLQDRRSGAQSGNSAADETHYEDERDAEDRDDDVRRASGKRDDDVASLEVAVVSRIHRNRLRAAECNSRRDEREKRQDDRQKRIDVLGGVPGEPPELIGGGVAVPECRIPVGIFMGDHRKKQDGRDQNECLELVQCRSREGPVRNGPVLLRVEVTQFIRA
jgi:hypothetical protein